MRNFREDIINIGLEVFQEIAKQVVNHLFSINAEIDNERLAYFEKIAGYGWTYGLDIYDACNRRKIETQEDADNIFYQLLVNEDYDEIELMMSIIELHPKIQKELSEAMKCYKNKEYRGCSMIVTSLIDKMLIMAQKEYSTDASNIKTGKAAAKAISSIMGNYNISETGEELYLSIISIMKFFEVFFERTNNFENDKSVINRNMLMHGMWVNDVTKVDCMKLFLALFNEVVVIDVYLGIKNIIERK